MGGGSGRLEKGDGGLELDICPRPSLPEFVVAPLTAADPTNIKVLQTYFDSLASNQRLRAKSCRVCSICGGVFGACAGSRVCVCDHLEFLPAACAQRSAVQRSAGIDVCRELIRFEAFIPHPIAEWSACWTQAQKGPGSDRSRDAVG